MNTNNLARRDDGECAVSARAVLVLMGFNMMMPFQKSFQKTNFLDLLFLFSNKTGREFPKLLLPLAAHFQE
jgi:hypothetical protein